MGDTSLSRGRETLVHKLSLDEAQPPLARSICLGVEDLLYQSHTGLLSYLRQVQAHLICKISRVKFRPIFKNVGTGTIYLQIRTTIEILQVKFIMCYWTNLFLKATVRSYPRRILTGEGGLPYQM